MRMMCRCCYPADARGWTSRSAIDAAKMHISEPHSASLRGAALDWRVVFCPTKLARPVLGKQASEQEIKRRRSQPHPGGVGLCSPSRLTDLVRMPVRLALTRTKVPSTECRNGFLPATGLAVHSWLRPPQTPTSNHSPPTLDAPPPSPGRTSHQTFPSRLNWTRVGLAWATASILSPRERRVMPAFDFVVRCRHLPR